MLVTEARLLPTLTKVLSTTLHITHVIYAEDYGDADTAVLGNLQTILPGAKFMSWTAFRTLGTANQHPINPPTPDLDACIMYTSGSTGAPKGVCLTHANVIAGIAAANYALENFFIPQDRLLAYLPLAHIIEFVVEHISLYWGATLGYGRPQTLTTTSGSLVGRGGKKGDPNIKGDIESFAPTVMTGVPAVWEGVKKGIVNKVAAAGFVKRNIFTLHYMRAGGDSQHQILGFSETLPSVSLTKLYLTMSANSWSGTSAQLCQVVQNSTLRPPFSSVMSSGLQ